MLVTATQAHGVQRCPQQTELVSVGVESTAVARVAIAAVHEEIIGKQSVSDERQTHLREDFFDRELTGDWRYRTNRARHVAQLLLVVRHEGRLLLAPFRPQVEL